MTTTKKRKPWNAVDEQVYSISSSSKEGVSNMNIATYVVPVTMSPKQYLIAVYRDTQTHSNIFKTKKPFLLQALSKDQIHLVRVLGKKSGKVYNKSKYIDEQPTAIYKDKTYLLNSSFVLSCTPKEYITLGDHDLVIVEIDKIVMNSNTNYLTTKLLQDVNIIG